MAKEELPCVVLRIQEHALTPCAGDLFKATGRITVSAEVTDFAIWDKAVEKLDGMVVYAATTLPETLPETLVECAQRRAVRAEEVAMQVNEDARVRIEALEANIAFRLQDIAQRDALIAQQNEELAFLRDFEKAVNATQR
jgi:hypothetical protein